MRTPTVCALLLVVACGSESSGSSGNSGSGGAGATGGSGAAGATGGAGGNTGCHSADDCDPAFEQCLVPGQFAGCGPCEIPDPACTTDTECKAQGAQYICELPLCSCDNTTKGCVVGCATTADCGANLECDATNRCVPMSCNATCADPNFDCNGGSCLRRSCSADGECSDFCVNGTCWPTIGECTDLAA